MSITRMRLKMGAGMKVILGIILAIFVIMIFAYFGGRGRFGDGRSEPVGITKVVAVVNGEKISRVTFDKAFAQMLDAQRMQADVRSLEPLRASVLNSLIEQQVQVQVAKQRGIRVSRGDVKRRINELIEAQLAAYQQQFGKRADVSEQRSRLRGRFADEQDAIRDQIMIDRLRERIEAQVKVTDQDLLENYDQALARHILVSTREPEEGKALSDAEAKKKAEGLLAQIKEGADFAQLAERESDDPGSASEGGSLGWVKHGQMVPEFEKAAFALKKGETSGLLKTDFGYHIIRVEDRRRELPEDFEKNKKKLREDLLTQRKAEAWQTFVQEQREKAEVTLPDPELRGAVAYLEGDRDQALKDFQAALKEMDRLGEEIPGAVYFSIAQIYMSREEWRKAAQSLEKAVDVATSEMLPIYVELGRAYLELGEKKKAQEYYELASEEYPEDFGTLWQLKRGFEELGDEKRAAEMDRLLQEAWQQQMEEAASRAPGEAPAPR